MEFCLALACLVHMSHEEQDYEVEIAMQCLDLEISNRSTCMLGLVGWRKLGVEANVVTIALHNPLAGLPHCNVGMEAQ